MKNEKWGNVFAVNPEEQRKLDAIAHYLRDALGTDDVTVLCGDPGFMFIIDDGHRYRLIVRDDVIFAAQNGLAAVAAVSSSGAVPLLRAGVDRRVVVREGINGPVAVVESDA